MSIIGIDQYRFKSSKNHKGMDGADGSTEDGKVSWKEFQAFQSKQNNALELDEGDDGLNGAAERFWEAAGADGVLTRKEYNAAGRGEYLHHGDEQYTDTLNGDATVKDGTWRRMDTRDAKDARGAGNQWKNGQNEHYDPKRLTFSTEQGVPQLKESIQSTDLGFLYYKHSQNGKLNAVGLQSIADLVANALKLNAGQEKKLFEHLIEHQSSITNPQRLQTTVNAGLKEILPAKTNPSEVSHNPPPKNKTDDKPNSEGSVPGQKPVIGNKPPLSTATIQAGDVLNPMQFNTYTLNTYGAEKHRVGMNEQGEYISLGTAVSDSEKPALRRAILEHITAKNLNMTDAQARLAADFLATHPTEFAAFVISDFCVSPGETIPYASFYGQHNSRIMMRNGQLIGIREGEQNLVQQRFSIGERLEPKDLQSFVNMVERVYFLPESRSASFRQDLSSWLGSGKNAKAVDDWVKRWMD